MNDFLPNPGQAAAITAPFDRPVRVVAGAGTGKTEVVARRYRHVLTTAALGRVRPENVLVLTFSEKAAAEMRARIARAVTARGAGLGLERLDLAAAPIRTFHSFCARLLADHGLRAGLDPGLPLLDEIDSAELLEEAQAAFLTGGFRAAYGGFDPLASSAFAWEAGEPFKAALAVIDQLRDQAVAWQDFDRRAYAVSSDAYRVLAPLVSWLYREYLERLAGRGQLDFDRLIMEATALLESAPDLRATLRARYRVLLVDEYQDTNYAQEQLLRALAGDGFHNATVVGDPRQAIYVWREARVENIARFATGGPPRIDAPLVENRRSLSPILAVANHAIAGYALGEPREFDPADQLRPGPGQREFSSPVVSLQAAPTREAEAQAVAGWVQRLLAEGFALREIALLIRARTHLPVYLAALQTAGIPVEVSAGDAFYARPEVLDAIHLLQVCLDPGDDLALARVLASPAAGLSQAQVAGLRPKDQRGLWSAMLAPAALAPDAATRLARLVAFWDEAQLQRWRLPPAAFVGWALRQSGLGRPGTDTGQRALQKLLAVAHAFAGQHPDQGLRELVAYLLRLATNDRPAKVPELSGTAGAVPVMTVHASKGLEFPVVIAADCRQVLNPRRDFQPFHDLQAGLVLPRDDEDDPAFVERVRRARNEARCLWYVTLTRARQRLIITTTNPAALAEGRYPRETTFFEELWNRLADNAVEGVVLEPPAADSAGPLAAADAQLSDAAIASGPRTPDSAVRVAAQALRDRLRARLQKN